MSRTGPLVTVAVVALVASSGVVACASPPNESQRYLAAVSIPGYRLARTGLVYNSAVGYFVGPSPAPAASAIVAPNLVLEPAPIQIGVGRGSSDDTGACLVRAEDEGSGAPVVDLVDEDELSGEEVDGLRAGTLTVVLVDVMCDAQSRY
ncbi:hypothetical protein J2S43_001214 [Catenuloplanes nepalensis]|uniref:Lipoprotein n=1 Tax=Catenuloplanes nepalensis TaxID=587533 RepID=A0ABT9MMR7_9ACTN|nr:hypothetical protein [Catenuloplanes nepalensis]MDP9792702.1 hypothetical protein [Catenuloplanes nepalensis]